MQAPNNNQQHASGRAAQPRPASGRRQTQEQQAGRVNGLPAQEQQQPGPPGHDAAQQVQQQPPGRSLESALPEDVLMDQIISKLQLLSYEHDFCRRKKPHRLGLTPAYFVSAQHSLSGNEQFFYFTSLAVWLLRLCNVTLPTPKEFDDPNATLQGILQGLRGLGFAGLTYPPSKLAQGWGREVCGLLDALAGAALEHRGLVRLPRATFQQDSVGEGGEAALVEEVGAEDDVADITSQAAAALLLEAEASSGSEAALPGPAMLRTSTAGAPLAPQAPGAAAADAAAKQALISTVDAVAWRMEAARVAPKLRLSLAPDMRNWRQHLEAAHAHLDSLAAAWPEARAQLEALGSDVASSLDKVDGREQQLNSQHEVLLAAYRESRLQLNDMQQEFSRRSELISERNNELHRVAAALEEAKQQLEARGSNLADASPLVRLKGAMASLRTELRGMELRIGVAAHNLVSLSLRDKQAALQDAAKRRVQDVAPKPPLMQPGK